MTPSYVSIFFTSIFNNTSLSILKVLLASLWLPSSFAMLSESPAHVLPCCAFSFKRYAVFLSTVFEHLHYFYLFEMTSYPLFFFIWHLFFPHLLHSTYVTIISSINHPSSSRHASLEMSSPQCPCVFCCKTCTGLLLHCCASCSLVTCAASLSSALLSFFYCVFCSFTIHAAFSTPFFSAFFYIRHSLHLCLFSLHLKHSTSTISCLLTTLSSTPYYITLLNNTSNLFWGVVVPFSSFFLFL